MFNHWRKIIAHFYPQITSIENLLVSWDEFIIDKKKKVDVRIFASHFLLNILSLHDDLIHFNYKHASYQRFNINDPKDRIIHKATVRDRLLHHAIYRILYLIFDKIFIFDSYSCRLGKGTHKAVKRLEKFTRIVSKNYTIPCWALKCDIKKYFASVDHDILFNLIKRKIKDKDVLWLILEIINSFNSRESNKGIPIGNLTSQLFANIYLNELDQFIKHRLKIKYYLRYCDDFIVLSNDANELKQLVSQISEFLENKLKLGLHPDKISIRKLKQGIDFLGYIILPHFILPRTKTLQRILGNLDKTNASLQSYLGYLSHANTHNASQKLLRKFDFLGKKK